MLIQVGSWGSSDSADRVPPGKACSRAPATCQAASCTRRSICPSQELAFDEGLEQFSSKSRAMQQSPKGKGGDEAKCYDSKSGLCFKMFVTDFKGVY